MNFVVFYPDEVRAESLSCYGHPLVHGDFAGDYGLVEKWPSALDDVLTRVPLLIRAPGNGAGHVVREPVEHLVLATVHLGTAIVIEASLSFLGLGVRPPTPTWGGMLGEASTLLVPHWWMVVFPGIFITVAVLSFNLFGDGLRDALDPRLRGTR